MPAFNYKVKTPRGSVVVGTLDAPEMRTAAEMLRRQRYVVLDLKVRRGAGEAGAASALGGGISLFKPKVKAKDVVLFSRQLATMVGAGLPLMRGLGTMIDQVENPAMKDVVTKISDDIEHGISISQAMAKFPKIFNTLYVSMVAAGETAGNLDQILDRLAGYLEAAEELQRKVKGAMAYPSVIVSAVIVVVIFLMLFVIPTFVNVFQEAGAELPMMTQITIGMSNWMKDNIGVLIAIIAGMFFFLRWYRGTPNGSLAIDRILLRMPVFGQLIRKQAVARFTRTLSTMIHGGVPILQAMEVVAKTSGNRVVEEAVIKSMESIKEGEKISEPLKQSGVFPPMVIQMISVGEETGKLPEMLVRVADFYDSEVDTAVASLSSMIEPLVIIFMGVVVGFLVISMFMPMFELGQVATGM
jgi:type IV pilus assembly protein PilC